MVSREAIDYFSYDALCHDRVRKRLLGRIAPSKPAFIEGYRLGVVANSDYRTILPGKAFIAGEMFTLLPSEINLVCQFINMGNMGNNHEYKFGYDLVPIEARLPNQSSKEVLPTSTEVMTPLIRATALPIKELPPRAYGTVPNEEIEAMCRKARVIRAQYFAQPSASTLTTPFLNTDYPDNTR